MGQDRRDETPVVGERPDRHVLFTARHEFAQSHLGVVIGAHEACVSGQTAGLAKVREHGTSIGSLLELSRQLRERYDRCFELTGQNLESSRYLSYLDLAALGVGATRHELQVVDDDQAERFVEMVLEAAGL